MRMPLQCYPWGGDGVSCGADAWRADISARYGLQARPVHVTTHFDFYSVGHLVRWRLLAANNRDSGQSAVGYPSADACREALARLLGSLGELQAHHLRTPDQRWQWQLALGDEVLAQASRSFDRRHQCETACLWFIRMAPVAAIGATIRVVLARSPDAVPTVTLPNTSGRAQSRAGLALPWG
jgi:hypothetical protein